MKTLISILSIVLFLSIGVNLWQYYHPIIEKTKSETVYLPGEKLPSTIVYNLPEGNQSATVEIQREYEEKTARAEELIAAVKSLPTIDKPSQITNLIDTKMQLEMKLSEKDMVISENVVALNEKENEIKRWKDKYNSVKVNNTTNEVEVISEVSPKIVTSEKRDGFLKPKEPYTTITSENPSVKFYGLESYTFKNPKQKDFVELNLKLQGLYLNKSLIPYGGAELLFNPDGRIKPIVGYGYYYEAYTGKVVPYWLGGLQFNLVRF